MGSNSGAAEPEHRAGQQHCAAYPSGTRRAARLPFIRHGHHHPERSACVRDPRDCNPADTERVTTAPGDVFTTSEVHQYPTQDGKRTHLYLTADHGSARRTVRRPHMSADAAAQYLLDFDQPSVICDPRVHVRQQYARSEILRHTQISQTRRYAKGRSHLSKDAR
jgi:hypothetical protein